MSKNGPIALLFIALVIAVPVSFGIALFLTELSPAWLKRPLFTAASLLCAVAWSLPALTVARFLQGLGGAEAGAEVCANAPLMATAVASITSAFFIETPDVCSNWDQASMASGLTCIGMATQGDRLPTSPSPLLVSRYPYTAVAVRQTLTTETNRK